MRDFGSFLIWRVSILFFFYWAPKLPVLALIQIDWIQMDLCLPLSRVLVLPSLSVSTLSQAEFKKQILSLAGHGQDDVLEEHGSLVRQEEAALLEAV